MNSTQCETVNTRSHLLGEVFIALSIWFAFIKKVNGVYITVSADYLEQLELILASEGELKTIKELLSIYFDDDTEKVAMGYNDFLGWARHQLNII